MARRRGSAVGLGGRDSGEVLEGARAGRAGRGSGGVREVLEGSVADCGVSIPAADVAAAVLSLGRLPGQPGEATPDQVAPACAERLVARV